jgi:hypothetical protein
MNKASDRGELVSLIPLWICLVGVLALFAWQLTTYSN